MADEIKDECLPSAIADIEKEIEKIEKELHDKNEELTNLYTDKNRLLNRAVVTEHLEDDHYRIVKKISLGNRIADPAKLKLISREKWDLYEQAIKNKADLDSKKMVQKANEGLSKVIVLGIADDIFGEKTVNECSTRPETIRWEVVKK